MTAEVRILIAPSILAADFANLGRQVQAATEAGADLIHVDVMDGRFVPNISFGEVVVDAVRRYTNLPLNIHLMIEEPGNLMSSFLKSATDQVIVHAEACTHLHRTVFQVKEQGGQVGVALNPGTPRFGGRRGAAFPGHCAGDDGQPRLWRPEFHPKRPGQGAATERDNSGQRLYGSDRGGWRGQGRPNGARLGTRRGDNPGSRHSHLQSGRAGSGGNEEDARLCLWVAGWVKNIFTTAGLSLPKDQFRRLPRCPAAAAACAGCAGNGCKS